MYVMVSTALKQYLFGSCIYIIMQSAYVFIHSYMYTRLAVLYVIIVCYGSYTYGLYTYGLYIMYIK